MKRIGIVITAIALSLPALSYVYSQSGKSEGRSAPSNSVSSSPAESKGKEFVVYFERDAADLAVFAGPVVQAAAQLAKTTNPKQVLITGHCDTGEKNAAVLSHKRAQTVAEKLRALGVPEQVPLTVSGAGSQKPAIPTPPDVSEPLNRRVTVTIVF